MVITWARCSVAWLIAWVRIRLAGTGRRRRQLLLIESGAGIEQAQVGPQIVPEEGDERNVILRPFRLRVCLLTHANLLVKIDLRPMTDDRRKNFIRVSYKCSNGKTGGGVTGKALMALS